MNDVRGEFRGMKRLGVKGIAEAYRLTPRLRLFSALRRGRGVRFTGVSLAPGSTALMGTRSISQEV
jgi:hypothetical protein